jgi:hypothetical protein
VRGGVAPHGAIGVICVDPRNLRSRLQLQFQLQLPSPLPLERPSDYA